MIYVVPIAYKNGRYIALPLLIPSSSAHTIRKIRQKSRMLALYCALPKYDHHYHVIPRFLGASKRKIFGDAKDLKIIKRNDNLETLLKKHKVSVQHLEQALERIFVTDELIITNAISIAG